MALTQASLSGKIETELQAVFGSPADSAQLKKFCDAIAKAVVDEIKTNAVTTAAVTATVISGAGAGGNVTGTATGTVS